MHPTSGAWKLATKAASTDSARPAHGHEHPALGRQNRPAAYQTSATGSEPSLTATADQLQAGSAAELSGHGSVQVTLQQTTHPMGQRHSLPTTNGLDRLLLEGRFSADRRRGQLAFEWSLSTIRCPSVSKNAHASNYDVIAVLVACYCGGIHQNSTPTLGCILACSIPTITATVHGGHALRGPHSR
jgi:hypothetical protein